MKYNPKVVLAFFHDENIPAPQLEFRFHGERKWRFDFAWPEKKVALEVEGGIWTGGGHNRGPGYISDMEKYNIAALYGWRLFRVQPKDLCMVKTAALLRLAIHGWELKA